MISTCLYVFLLVLYWKWVHIYTPTNSPFLEIYWPYCKNTSPSYKDISWNFNFVAGFKFKIQHWMAVENIRPFCIWNYLQYIAYNTYLIAITDSTIIIKMILPVYYTLPLNKFFYYISLKQFRKWLFKQFHNFIMWFSF